MQMKAYLFLVKLHLINHIRGELHVEGRGATHLGRTLLLASFPEFKGQNYRKSLGTRLHYYIILHLSQCMCVCVQKAGHG